MVARRRVAAAGMVAAVCAATLVTLATTPGPGAPGRDPIRVEIDHWSAFLRDNKATDPTWTQVKSASAPALERAEQALRDGRRLLALERLAVARVNLAASEYLARRPGARSTDMGALESEWKRMGAVLGDAAKVPPGDALAGSSSALARAEGEAALYQVHVFYASSLDYGHATMPEAGLFYLGAADAQRRFAAFCRTLPSAERRPAPPVRPIPAEIDALNDELLRAYGPPASIERHSEFIVVSSLLNEARELDAAGLEYGALLRYLEAALRAATLRPAAAPALDAAELARRLAAFDRRLGEGGIDQSVGRLFLESAQADVAAARSGTAPEIAVAIATEVLPRYFAALQPPRSASVPPAPQATVTLVRWPYT